MFDCYFVSNRGLEFILYNGKQLLDNIVACLYIAGMIL